MVKICVTSSLLSVIELDRAAESGLGIFNCYKNVKNVNFSLSGMAFCLYEKIRFFKFCLIELKLKIFFTSFSNLRHQPI